MGFFTKKETTHFERDEEGQVVRTTRNGQEVPMVEPRLQYKAPEPQYKPTKQLEQEYYTRHPEKKPYMQRYSERRAKEKQIQTGAYTSAREKAIKQRATKRGRESVMRPAISFGYPPPRGSQKNYNPFGSMFDTGMTPMRKPKKKAKPKYHVRAGKAYPIAGTGHKKKKTKRKRQDHTGFGSDFFRW